MDRAPEGEAPERYTDLEDIHAARARGVDIPKTSRATQRAKEILCNWNDALKANGQAPVTMEDLDPDLLIEELHICRLAWSVKRTEPKTEEGNPVYSWVNLGSTCGVATTNRDGYIRHFRERHIGQPRRLGQQKDDDLA